MPSARLALAALLLAAAPRVAADALCAAPLSLTHTALPSFAFVANTSALAFAELPNNASLLPSLAVAGGGTVVLLENYTHVLMVNSISYGTSFYAPRVLGRKYGPSFSSVSGLGVVSDGSRFELIGVIGGGLASWSFIDNAFVANASNNGSWVYPILDTPPSFYAMGAKPGRVYVAADGGTLNALTIYSRNSRNISASWAQVPCPQCTRTSYPSAIASDGVAVMVCGIGLGGSASPTTTVTPTSGSPTSVSSSPTSTSPTTTSSPTTTAAPSTTSGPTTLTPTTTNVPSSAAPTSGTLTPTSTTPTTVAPSIGATSVVNCYLSSDGVTEPFVRLAYSPVTPVAGSLSLASAGTPNFYVAVYNTGNNVLQSTYTTTAGAQPWSTPMVVSNGVASPAVLIALAQDRYLAMYSPSGSAVAVAVLPYISQTWQTQSVSFSAPFALTSAGFGNDLAVAYFLSSSQLAVDSCFNPSVTTGPPSLSPTPSSGSRLDMAPLGSMVVLLATTLAAAAAAHAA